jgi:hypothetical protein
VLAGQVKQTRLLLGEQVTQGARQTAQEALELFIGLIWLPEQLRHVPFLRNVLAGQRKQIEPLLALHVAQMAEQTMQDKLEFP